MSQPCDCCPKPLPYGLLGLCSTYAQFGFDITAVEEDGAGSGMEFD